MCTWLEPRTWDMWWSKWLLFILLRLKAWLLNQVYQKQRTQNTYRKSWHTAPPSLHFEVLRMRHELRRQTAEGHSASEQTVCSWPKSWPQAILTGTISVIACYSHVACAQSTKPCSRWNEGSSCCKPENCRQPHYHHYLASIPFHSIPAIALWPLKFIQVLQGSLMISVPTVGSHPRASAAFTKAWGRSDLQHFGKTISWENIFSRELWQFFVLQENQKTYPLVI